MYVHFNKKDFDPFTTVSRHDMSKIMYMYIRIYVP